VATFMKEVARLPWWQRYGCNLKEEYRENATCVWLYGGVSGLAHGHRSEVWE